MRKMSNKKKHKLTPKKMHERTTKKNSNASIEHPNSYILLNESDGINNNMPATTKALVLF